MKFSYEDESQKVEYEVYNLQDLSWHTLMDHYANFLRSLGYIIEDSMKYLESYSGAYDVEGEKAALKQEEEERELNAAHNEVISYCEEGYTADLQEVLGYLGDKGLETLSKILLRSNNSDLWDELAKAEVERQKCYR